MAEGYLRQSALDHLHLAARISAATADAGVFLREHPHRAMVTLRGDAGDPKFLAAVKTAIGVAPPTEPTTSARARQRSILWMGPDEWLVAAPPAEREALPARLRKALEGIVCAVAEVGESMTVIEISGAHARDVLAKGCTIDLHASAFVRGTCVRTLLAKAGVILHQTDTRPVFELAVHRSFADYAWRWLVDGASEYGVAIGGD